MKLLFCLMFSLFFLNDANAQFSIKLDGNINEWIEWSDSSRLRSVVDEKNILISEDSLNYYIGIKSDVSTIGSIYLMVNNKIQILHASWAIDNAIYESQTNINSTQLRKSFKFTFRHPLSRQPHVKTSGLSIEMELYDYYIKNGWAASMIPMGSSREVEFVISKKIAPKGTQLAVTYLGYSSNNLSFSPEEGLQYFPKNCKITNSYAQDLELHRGRLSEKVQFGPNGWFIL